MAEETAPQPTVPAEDAGAQAPGPSLAISGVVLSKAQLLEALRAYVPGITDFSPLPDGEHFSILFAPDGPLPQR